ncbi:MAG: polysaccharide export protein [Flavobacteriales bacterium]|jgi:polysaccharide export outer membrane protein|nr:polysaccharide export protein [Flavobacteriales bacterium]MBP9159384.1 polysaccharide export protein [Flavobacteriales bacterium]MCI1753775.1 polysaccharide export protein [Flavobacteriales bacterium]
MKLTKIALVLMVLAMMSSCVSKRSINYLHDGSLSNTSKLFPNKKFEYRIQVNDVLSIRVLGLDDANARLFNVETTTGGVSLTDASLYVNGFSIDKSGNVQLPSVGKMHLQGMTVDEAQTAVQSKINEYFANATVILKMVSFRVSVLGEVNRPGSYFVYNNQISILEALAQSGGPTELADKRHLTLMRQSDQGTQALYVDLSSTAALSSEYFYLLPNDVVYVPTLSARPARLNLDILTILLSAISTAAVVITVVQNNNP